MPVVEVLKGARYAVLAWGTDDACDLQSFLSGLQANGNSDATHLLNLIKTTAERGAPRNPKQCKLLEDQIFEFKAPNGSRVLWFYFKGALVICSHGFVKKKQKTPRGEIDRAKRVRDEFRRENDKR